MNIASALAAGIDREITSLRQGVMNSSNPAKKRLWTDRDVSRRLADVGYPLVHTSVVRMRQGKRTISVQEWLHVALALSVSPLDLLGGGDLTIGSGEAERTESAGRVRAWIVGDVPLNTVPDPEHYATSAGRPVRDGQSHTAQVLHSMANQLDVAEAEEHEGLLTTAIQTLIGSLKAAQLMRARIQEKSKGRN